MVLRLPPTKHEKRHEKTYLLNMAQLYFDLKSTKITKTPLPTMQLKLKNSSFFHSFFLNNLRWFGDAGSFGVFWLSKSDFWRGRRCWLGTSFPWTEYSHRLLQRGRKRAKNRRRPYEGSSFFEMKMVVFALVSKRKCSEGGCGWCIFKLTILMFQNPQDFSSDFSEAPT